MSLEVVGTGIQSYIKYEKAPRKVESNRVATLCDALVWNRRA